MAGFLGNLRVPKTARRFVLEALYGIQTRQSVHLTEIARALCESIPLGKTVDRLSRQAGRAGLWEQLTGFVIREAAHRIKQRSLLVLDPSDLSKKYAEKMEHLARVRDGSEGKLANGYWLCSVVGVECGGAEVTPLVNRLWSQKAPDFQSENAEVLACVEALPDRIALGEQGDNLLRRFDALPVDDSHAPLRVGVVGDLYTMLEPFFNMDIERELGRLGVHVERSFWLSDSLGDMLQEKVLHRGRKFRRIRAAEPYLSRDIGGFARSTVGSAALFAQERVDGVIHLAPFSCTPEIMAHNALLTLRREYQVPILSLSFDEHTGRAGFLTRLEAFVDILERRRQRQPGPPPQTGWRGVPSFPLSGLLESLEGRLGEGLAALVQTLREGVQASDAESRPENERL